MLLCIKKLITLPEMKRVAKTLKNSPVLIILSMAVIVRLVFLLNYLNSPEWNQLLVDSLFHDRWASAIAGGNFWGNEVFFRAPFYIYILGGIYYIFGHSLLAARIFGMIIGLASVYATYSIASGLFSKRTAFIAAGLHALYPIIIYFESELLVDMLFTFLVQVSIIILFKALENTRLKWFIYCGLIIGLAAVTRPVILAMIPIYLVWIFISAGGYKRAGLAGLFFLVSIAAIIAPVTVRNYFIANDQVLIASSGGINFYLGNNDSADGLSAAMPPPLGSSWEIRDIKFIAEEETGHKLTSSQLSDFWRDKALAWIIENPSHFINLYLKKIYFCLNNSEISNNRNLALFFDDIPVLKLVPLNYGLVISLAFMGIFFLLTQAPRNSHHIFLILFLLIYLLVISMFFINARFRLPIIPILIILGSFSIDNIIRLISEKRHMLRVIYALAVGIIVFLLAGSNIYAIAKDNYVAGYFNKGNYFLFQGNYTEADKYYRLLLSKDPQYPDANMNLGVVYFKQGDGDSARYYFDKEITFSPDNAKAYSNLASLSLLENDYEAARQYSDTAINLRPYLEDPYLILMRIANITHDTAALFNIINQAEAKLSNKIGMYYEAGLIFSEWQNYNNAITYLIRSFESKDVPIETDDRAFEYTNVTSFRAKAAYQLGYIYGMTGNLQESLAMSNRAIALDSGLTEAYINLANAYLTMNNSTEAKKILNLAKSKFPDVNLIDMLWRQIK